VIGQMFEHNLAVILYGNHDVFVGVYPNDPLTFEAVGPVARGRMRAFIWRPTLTMGQPPKGIA
jgi:hypothetical protein